MSNKEFSELADAASDAEGSEYSEYSDSSDGEEERKLKQKMENLKKQKHNVEEAAEGLSRNAQIEAKHSKMMMQFAPRWLLAPFVPLIISLATIVHGSIIVNTTPLIECTEPLPFYAVGTVIVSYLYVIVYGSAFIGFFNMKWTNMFSYKLTMGFVCFLGFVIHVVGTALLGGAAACEELTPKLYAYCSLQMLVFWITFAIYVLCALRALYLKKYASQREQRAAQADRIRKLEEEDRRLKQQALEAEEAQRAKEQAEEEEAERRRLEQEAEDAKKREMIDKYGETSDEESDDETKMPMPGSVGEQ